MHRRADLSLFLSCWARQPLRTGAVLPSSPELAQKMAAQVDIGRDETIVELGAGTGAVTQALLDRGISADRLLVVEHNAAFCRRLKAKFAGLRVLQGDARNLRSLLPDEAASRIGAVVSSLPFRSLSGSVQDAVLKEIFEVLECNGTFVQFTYAPVSPISGDRLRSLGLHGQMVERVWRNLPPAAVWCYQACSSSAVRRKVTGS